MIVAAFCILVIGLVTTAAFDQTQIEKYGVNRRTTKYQLDVPGKDPITIIETASPTEDSPNKWIDITLKTEKGKDVVNIKNLMTDIIHDPSSEKPRCYGPSCQEGFIEDQGPQGDLEEYLAEYADKLKDYRDYSSDYPSDRIQAISALASKLKNNKLKADRYYGLPHLSSSAGYGLPQASSSVSYGLPQASISGVYGSPQSSSSSLDDDEDDNGKVHTAWNRLKVKRHKHPFDDKDGWVTLEPVAWSTSKISKWKPNVKKQKPSHWNDEDDGFPNNDGYFQQSETTQPFRVKKPAVIRPAYINNKLHMSSASDWDTEMPSKPTWSRPPSLSSYPSSWSPDDSRRPHKPSCDSDEQQASDDTVYYGISDSVVTDNRPTHFPYEYEALKRPIQRPTQVVYAGSPDVDNDRTSSRPSFGNGQWVLLSTTKGYRNKKRQRSLFGENEEKSDPQTMTSHQAVSLTVLPPNDGHTNMTTSHGGLLEVERSFKTVEESKRDMDKENEYRPDLNVESSDQKPFVNKIIRRKLISNAVAPDSSTVLAAVGAGMVPATMAMVVPMMIGRRRRRDLSSVLHAPPYNNVILNYE